MQHELLQHNDTRVPMCFSTFHVANVAKEVRCMQHELLQHNDSVMHACMSIFHAAKSSASSMRTCILPSNSPSQTLEKTGTAMNGRRTSRSVNQLAYLKLASSNLLFKTARKMGNMPSGFQMRSYTFTLTRSFLRYYKTQAAVTFTLSIGRASTMPSIAPAIVISGALSCGSLLNTAPVHASCHNSSAQWTCTLCCYRSYPGEYRQRSSLATATCVSFISECVFMCDALVEVSCILTGTVGLPSPVSGINVPW